MISRVGAPSSETLQLDYSLTGITASLAIEKGLAEADWYQCPVPRSTMRVLLERRDGPAALNTLLWLALILLSAALTIKLWGGWWAALPYVFYTMLYASTSDSRWHEAGHDTAFKTDLMNIVLYELASFMVMRESIVWRWSHTRHHSDTIIVGRDPEIAVPRPPNLREMFLSLFNLGAYLRYFSHIAFHSLGRMGAEEKTYIPEIEFGNVFLRARLYVAIYAGVISLAIGMHSLLPLMLVGLTNLFGSWLMVVYGFTQHASLAENVLDHRLNCRTILMNPINRFLYWNMNFHIEHHMFPLAPFHALPALHEATREDCPPPYPSLWSAWSEIFPAILEQRAVSNRNVATFIKELVLSLRTYCRKISNSCPGTTCNSTFLSTLRFASATSISLNPIARSGRINTSSISSQLTLLAVNVTTTLWQATARRKVRCA